MKVILLGLFIYLRSFSLKLEKALYFCVSLDSWWDILLKPQ